MTQVRPSHEHTCAHRPEEPRRQPPRAGKVPGFAIALTAATLAGVLALGGATPAYAIASDAYLGDFTAHDGHMVPVGGDLSGLGESGCAVRWEAQAVFDRDLPDPSMNGFLQSTTPNAAGIGGYLELQHWAIGNRVHWRIPIATNQPIADATVSIVFDDADWAPDQGSLSISSAFPGSPSGFNRFMGLDVGVYSSHDDAQVSSAWTVNGAGHAVLNVHLGDLGARSSTVLQFSGQATSHTGPPSTPHHRGNPTLGLRAVLTSELPLADCFEVRYGTAGAVSGRATASAPASFSWWGGAATPGPLGTRFELGNGAPHGMTIDEHTGRIWWHVPEEFALGSFEVPVIVTFADDAYFAAGSVRHTTAGFHVYDRDPSEPADPGITPEDPGSVPESSDPNVPQEKPGSVPGAQNQEGPQQGAGRTRLAVTSPAGERTEQAAEAAESEPAGASLQGRGEAPGSFESSGGAAPSVTLVSSYNPGAQAAAAGGIGAAAAVGVTALLSRPRGLGLLALLKLSRRSSPPAS